MACGVATVQCVSVRCASTFALALHRCVTLETTVLAPILLRRHHLVTTFKSIASGVGWSAGKAAATAAVQLPYGRFLGIFSHLLQSPSEHEACDRTNNSRDKGEGSRVRDHGRASSRPFNMKGGAWVLTSLARIARCPLLQSNNAVVLPHRQFTGPQARIIQKRA